MSNTDATIFLDNALAAPMRRQALAAWLASASAPPDTSAARDTAAALARELAAELAFELVPLAGGGKLAPGAAADERSFSVSWFAGAAEANCALVTGAVRRYAAATRRQPHVVTSAGDPPSVLACCRALQAERACDLTVLPIGRAGAALGRVDSGELQRALRANTCLVTIAAVSADAAGVNDLRALAAVARARRVPFHSDVSLLLGAGAPDLLPACRLDAWTAGFAHIGGGALAACGVRRTFAAGYGLAPYLGGETAASGELRAAAGGAEAILALAPALAAARAAWREHVAAREAQPGHVARLRAELLLALARAADGAAAPAPLVLDDCPADSPPSIDGGLTPPGPPLHNGSSAGRAALRAGAPAVFLVAARDGAASAAPGCVLIAVAGASAEAVREAAAARGVVVGRAGRATVSALNLPAVLQRGLLRISLGHSLTRAQVQQAAQIILEAALAADAEKKSA
jgi:cysteine desulfurase